MNIKQSDPMSGRPAEAGTDSVISNADQIHNDSGAFPMDKDNASLRIGFNEGYDPSELRGYTGLESLVNLHFLSYPNDSQEEQEALARFKSMCARIDAIFEEKLVTLLMERVACFWYKHFPKYICRRIYLYSV